jgi:hypothetical protein
MTEGKGKRRYRRRGPRKPKAGVVAPPGETPQGAGGFEEQSVEGPPAEGTGEGAPEWGEDPGVAAVGEPVESAVESSGEGAAPKKGRRRSRRRGKKGKGAAPDAETGTPGFSAETPPPPGADVPDPAGIPPASPEQAPAFVREPAIAEPMGAESTPPPGEGPVGEPAAQWEPGEPGRTGRRRRRRRRRRRGKGQVEGAGQILSDAGGPEQGEEHPEGEVIE